MTKSREQRKRVIGRYVNFKAFKVAYDQREKETRGKIIGGGVRFQSYGSTQQHHGIKTENSLEEAKKGVGPKEHPSEEK